MGKRAQRDYAGAIIAAATAVQVARFAGAFLASDAGRIDGWLSTVVTVLTGISGVGAGVLDAVGLAWIMAGLRAAIPARGREWSRRGRIVLWLAVATVLDGIIILTPYTVARTTQAAIADIMPPLAVWLWSLAVNAAPYLVIAAAMTGHTSALSGRKKDTAADSTSVSDVSADSDRTVTGQQDTPQDTKQSIVARLAQEHGVSERTIRRWKAAGKIDY